MTLSPRMLALIQKLDAAEVEHFAGLREKAKKASQARAELLEKKRENLRIARAVGQAKREATARADKKAPKR